VKCAQNIELHTFARCNGCPDRSGGGPNSAGGDNGACLSRAGESRKYATGSFNMLARHAALAASVPGESAAIKLCFPRTGCQRLSRHATALDGRGQAVKGSRAGNLDTAGTLGEWVWSGCTGPEDGISSRRSAQGGIDVRCSPSVSSSLDPSACARKCTRGGSPFTADFTALSPCCTPAPGTTLRCPGVDDRATVFPAADISSRRVRSLWRRASFAFFILSCITDDGEVGSISEQLCTSRAAAPSLHFPCYLSRYDLSLSVPVAALSS